MHTVYTKTEEKCEALLETMIAKAPERESFYLIRLHTMNPVGREAMQREIDRYWKKQGGKKTGSTS